MRRTWKKAKPKQEKRFRANQQIRVPEVFVVDEEGEKIGKMPTAKAKALAEEVDMDLVEVNPKADPPIVKIMDYSQFKYEQEKKAHKQKQQQKKVETKGIRLSVRISQHDLDMRLEQARKFLKKGDRLKMELILKGREKQHPAKAAEMMNDFVSRLDEDEDLNIMREQDLTKQGGKYIMMLLNKKE
jgi:translation initiation factor IF-3